MPQLLIFAPCQKVIVDREEGLLSIISLMQDMHITTPPGVSMPTNELYPVSWQIAIFWRRIPEDEGKEYEQRFELILPNGEIATESLTTFQMTRPAHHVVLNLPGFPIGYQGDYILRLALREINTDIGWNICAEYPITAIHTQEESHANNPGT